VELFLLYIRISASDYGVMSSSSTFSTHNRLLSHTIYQWDLSYHDIHKSDVITKQNEQDLTQFGTANGLRIHTQDNIEVDVIASAPPRASEFQYK